MPPTRARSRKPTPRTSCVVFPFDLFGNAGTGAGAQLLADVLREAVDDTARETRPTRPDAYARTLRFDEYEFDSIEAVQNWRQTGQAAARSAVAESDFTLWLAGNHLGVLPVYDLLGPETLVIQFDAHLDCYALHDTSTNLSHGNWLLHVDPPGPRLVSLGHRDLFLKPGERDACFELVIPAEDMTAEASRAALRSRLTDAQRIWLDLDVDYIDPAFAPAVHQPLPFGPTPVEVLNLIREIWSDRVIGVSISEFDPGRDDRDRTLHLLAWLLERILLLRYE